MTAFHVMAGASGEFARPEVRKIGIADIADALRLGLEDFKEKPSHYFFSLSHVSDRRCFHGDVECRR